MVKHFPFQDNFKINQNGVLILARSPEVKCQPRLRDGSSNIILLDTPPLLHPGEAMALRGLLHSPPQTRPQMPDLSSRERQGAASAYNPEGPPAISDRSDQKSDMPL